MSEKSRVPALERFTKVLQVLCEQQRTAGELLKLTGMPKSTLYILLDEMESYGYIRQNADGKYQLWSRLISLGEKARESIDIKDMVSPALQMLLSQVDCLAVHYGEMNKNHAYYIIKKISPKAGMSILSREGMEVNLVHAGLGKCLLAFQDDETVNSIIPKLDFTPKTATSIKSERELREEIARIRKQKWAFDNSEGEEEIRCVAVPVFTRTGRFIGAISIVGTLNQFSDDKLDNIVSKTVECSKNISSSLA